VGGKRVEPKVTEGLRVRNKSQRKKDTVYVGTSLKFQNDAWKRVEGGKGDANRCPTSTNAKLWTSKNKKTTDAKKKKKRGKDSKKDFVP